MSKLIQLEKLVQVQLDREGELRRCLKSPMNLQNTLLPIHGHSQIKHEILYQQQSVQFPVVKGEWKLK